MKTELFPVFVAKNTKTAHLEFQVHVLGRCLHHTCVVYRPPASHVLLLVHSFVRAGQRGTGRDLLLNNLWRVHFVRVRVPGMELAQARVEVTRVLQVAVRVLYHHVEIRQVVHLVEFRLGHLLGLHVRVAVHEAVQHIGMGGAGPQVALDQVCLSGRVLVHQAVFLDVQGLLVFHDAVPERSAKHLLGGALKVGPFLARHQLLPFFAKFHDLASFAERPLLFDFAEDHCACLLL